MLRCIIIFVFLVSISFKTLALTINCYGGFTSTITLPSSTSLDQITAGLTNDTTTFRKLYSYNYIRFGSSNSQCEVTESGESTTLDWVAFVNSDVAPLSYDGNVIFPTSVSGIGLSFNDMSFGGEKAVNIISSPTVLESWTLNNTRTLNNKNFNIKITIWKIPGTLASQSLDFAPIRIDLGLQAKASDNFASRMNMGNSPAISANIWSVVVGRLSGSINLNPGTCDIANKTVFLGGHQGNRPSAWNDASFTINCLTAWGYGMTANMDSANAISSRSANTPNAGVTISVLPITNVITNIPGTIALKTGGATGYGIQLAWGATNDLSNSASAPASVIIFNTPIEISNQVFALGSKPGPMIIKMAARYIPTGEARSPGIANSSIEVVASYN